MFFVSRVRICCYNETMNPISHNAIKREHANADTIVLFLHGFMGSPNQFSSCMEAVYRCGFSAVAPLLPGHGGDVKAFSAAACADWQACVEAEIERCAARHKRVYLVGHSMGGLLALLAASLPQSPIVGVFAIAPPLKVRLFAMKKLLLPFYAKSHPIRSAYREANSISDIRLFTLARLIAPTRELFRLMRAARVCLPRVTVPVCLVHSKGDETTAFSSAKLLYDGLHNAPRKALSLHKSWHAYYEPSEEALIMEELLKVLNKQH